jgi:hypothetical protein
MARKYRKMGNRLEITKEVVEEISVADLQMKRARIVQEIAHFQAVLADIDFMLGKAAELGVNT